MRILLVEDDEQIGDGVRAGLRLAGHTVNWVVDCRSARAAHAAEPCDLMILDVGLPDENGLNLLRELRSRADNLPVLLLTARDTVADKVTGLDSGADDYLVKPFELAELCARLRAIERRQHGRPEPVIRHAGIELDPSTHTVKHHGHEVPLSRREFAILERLMEARGKAISRSALEHQLYAWGEEVASNAVEVHIHHLRKKLGERMIRTIRGVGYLIAGDG
jgi:DNA-binding response OmpR family regulator